jgi:hypothetical protein
VVRRFQDGVPTNDRKLTVCFTKKSEVDLSVQRSSAFAPAERDVYSLEATYKYLRSVRSETRQRNLGIEAVALLWSAENEKERLAINISPRWGEEGKANC